MRDPLSGAGDGPVEPPNPPVIEAIEQNAARRLARLGLVPGAEIQDDATMIRVLTGVPLSFMNGVARARLSPEDADAGIEAVIGGLEERGVPGAWWVGPLATPGDLIERLGRAGFSAHEEVPWLAAALDALPASRGPDGLRIVPVDSVELLELHDRAATLGFASHPVVADTFHRLNRLILVSGDDGDGLYVGLLDDQPVATAGLTLAGGVAGVYGVSTVPAARRRGIAAAMTIAVLHEARDRGYGVAVLGSSETGLGLYRRLGFREVCRVTCFVRGVGRQRG